MPVYEYRCLSCETVFEARRPMADAPRPAPCPRGHLDSVRLLSVFAAPRRAAAEAAVVCGAPLSGGCGAGCACHAAG